MTRDGFDEAIRPQDDLFGHVNGGWLATAEIPEDRATHGSFEMLRDASEEDVRAIIEEAAARQGDDPDERRIGDLYASFMNTEAVEAAGVEPLRPLLDEVDAVQDIQQFVVLMGRLAREGVTGILSVGPWIDKGDPTRWLLHLAQSGLGLPDESYYRLDEHEAIRRQYVAHTAAMLGLVGVTEDPHGVAEAIMAMETRIAEAHWDRPATRDAVKTYNLTTAEDLVEALPLARSWLEAMGLAHEDWAEVVVSQPDVVDAVTRLLVDGELSGLKQWLTWRVIRTFAPYLSNDIVEENFAFYGTVLTGAPALRARWKRGVSLVESVLGEAVGHLYVQRHYPPESETQMAALVANLLEAYRLRITDLPWMEEETRQRALAKLSAFTPKIGKPVKWRDYSGLEVDAGDLVGNVRRATAFEFDWSVDKLRHPVDRDEWFMTPQTVNAYYNPAMNEIVFPAAILQPPFFDPAIDPAYNYGAIGAVIGHEIGHGFDDQGSRYDGDGTLRDWWTPADRERFEAKAKALIAQYDAFSPRGLPDDHRVNGSLTVGENIGDLGGVAVAHHAYRLSLDGVEPPVEDGMTGEQRFFVGWAKAWRVVAREAEAIRRLTIDPHSPPEFRTNVVRNIDGFHEAFQTQPGDGLWLDPEDRVSIW